MGFIFDLSLPMLDIFVTGICTLLLEIDCDWILIALALEIYHKPLWCGHGYFLEP